jgi:hypothetical protein
MLQVPTSMCLIRELVSSRIMPIGRNCPEMEKYRDEHRKAQCTYLGTERSTPYTVRSTYSTVPGGGDRYRPFHKCRRGGKYLGRQATRTGEGRYLLYLMALGYGLSMSRHPSTLALASTVRGTINKEWPFSSNKNLIPVQPSNTEL